MDVQPKSNSAAELLQRTDGNHFRFRTDRLHFDSFIGKDKILVGTQRPDPCMGDLKILPDSFLEHRIENEQFRQKPLYLMRFE